MLPPINSAYIRKTRGHPTRGISGMKVLILYYLYSGLEADVVEAPAGSVVLYDARTWHRAGFNHSHHKRGAMLMSFQTADVTPKKDTRPTCAKLHESPVYQELSSREQQEITELMMNQPDMPTEAGH